MSLAIPSWMHPIAPDSSRTLVIFKAPLWFICVVKVENKYNNILKPHNIFSKSSNGSVVLEHIVGCACVCVCVCMYVCVHVQ